MPNAEYMQWPDYAVLIGYFVILIVIGIYSALRIKKQEDFFMGGRSFGKLLQTFAAFGAGTGSSDPVNTGRTTFVSGMSGMWSVMYWLFVTPFYWITGVWYRRMRHLTLGDWFVERYESKALGAAYCVFGLLFFMVYGSMLFSAIGKVAAPLIGVDHVTWGGEAIGIEYILVPVIGVVVLVYGIAGGLRAAYFTDLIQGVCIIILSIMLIPFGLSKLADTDPNADSWIDGFRVMHERLPPEYFDLVGSSGSEFPLHRIIAVVIIALIGIVVQPHFIATGGGSAKTEFNARVGLVTGNFLKRLCSVGWALTALVAVALFSQSPELVQDPDRTWGVASRELLGPGLTGLMLACLLAALMSSADAYMIVGSGLVVRNLYAPYIDNDASEATYVRLGRLTGGLVIAGAVVISLFMMDVFKQLQLTWVFPVLFAAPFWLGMYWRRATTTAAWATVAYCALIFFAIPFFAPRWMPQLRDQLLETNRMVRLETTRPASPSDADRENVRRSEAIRAWQQRQDEIQQMPDSDARREALEQLGPRPTLLEVGQPYTVIATQGGQSVFWGDGVVAVDQQGNPLPDVTPQPIGPPQKIDDQTTEIPLGYSDDVRLQGRGNLKLDFLLYQWMGMNFRTKDDATLSTLELPPKIIAPFLVMILVSLVTPRNSKAALDRYYTKMKTPVHPDPKQDEARLLEAEKNPEQMELRKLFPGSDFEFQRPTMLDVGGFVLSFIACFGIIGLAAWVVSLGR